MGVGGQRHAPAALPPEKTRYPLHRRLGGLQGRSGRVRKTSPPPGFDPRSVQPVASRYTDWAITANTKAQLKKLNKYMCVCVCVCEYYSREQIYGNEMGCAHGTFSE
jgi:hypothetical protein